MSADALAGSSGVVVTDRELQRELLATDGRDQFAALVVRRAAQRGWVVTVDDVEHGLRAGYRAWAERWI